MAHNQQTLLTSYSCFAALLSVHHVHGTGQGHIQLQHVVCESDEVRNYGSVAACCQQRASKQRACMPEFFFVCQSVIGHYLATCSHCTPSQQPSSLQAMFLAFQSFVPLPGVRKAHDHETTVHHQPVLVAQSRVG